MAPDVTKANTLGVMSEPPRRRLRSMAAVAVLLGVLVPAALGDSLVTRMHSIGDTLRSDLSGALGLAAQVNYSKPIYNATYVSDTLFNMKGMGFLYNATAHVINAIANKDAYPADLVKVQGDHVELMPLRLSWKPLLVHYAGLFSAVVLVGVFVVIFPLAGLCWCCCYCAHSRRQQPFDRKHDSCVKGILALLLICVITLFMFGVVCSFVTDEHVEMGAAELPAAQERALADVSAFLNETDAHQRHLLVTNYGELESKLLGLINSSGEQVSVQLGEFSRAVSVTTLNTMVQELDHVRANLVVVQNVTSALRYNAGLLDQALRKVKHRLLEILANCSQAQCRRLQDKYKIGELGADIDYSQLPDVTLLLKKVNELINGNIKTEVEEGQRVFNDLKNNIQRSVDEHIPTMRTALTDTGKELANISQQISQVTLGAERQVRGGGGQVVLETRRYVHDYGPYRRYVGIAVCCCVLTVLLSLVLGLLCGVCGKRPEGYGNNDCCNKGTGSRCLLTGMVLMFLLGWAVAAVMLVYLLIGVAAQRFVCDPLAQPEGNRLFGDLEKVVQLEQAIFHEKKDQEFNMSAVIRSCHQNKTIYEVLHLHRLLNLEELQERMRDKLHSQVARLTNETTFRQQHRVILKPSARAKLEQLADSGLSDFPFDRFTDVLVTNITSINLTSLAQQLTSTANEIERRSEFSAVTMELRDAATLLNSYQRDIVEQMLIETAKLNDTAIELRDGLRFNHTSFKAAVQSLLAETAGAETFLSTQGSQLVRNLTNEFAEGVAAMLQDYLERVVSAANYDVGRCAPLSNAYNATLNATCRKILMPLNGFWISLLWCLLLFFPIIVIAQKLAKLYTKTDPYPGPLVEAEYMYDAYADRDNIPLANAYLAEKRSRRGERGGGSGGGERGGGGGGGGGERERRAGGAGVRAERGGGGGGPERVAVAVEGAPPPLDAHNARRYTDMAPKHWEEGPPRYHGPTEYERPPPYYYPGPDDSQ